MFLIFDTETTGLPRDYNAPITDTENWPRCIQIAWQLHDETGKCIEHQDFLIQPNGFDIPFQSEQIHGISTELAKAQGQPLEEVLEAFKAVLAKSKYVVGQNVDFDIKVMGCEFYRKEVENSLTDLPVLDTCTETTAELCQIPGGRGGKFKLPTLTELHEHLFNQPFAEAHNATADVEATTSCFLELVRREVFTPEELEVEKEFFTNFKKSNPDPIKKIGLDHLNLKKESAKIKSKEGGDVEPSISKQDAAKNLEALSGVPFAHLHNHTQFSVLQATSDIKSLVKKAASENMPAVAITDLGNMMGAFQFVNAISKHNKGIEEKAKAAEEQGREFVGQTIKPIVGCELFVCRDRNDKTTKDNGFQVPFLAKNKNGYHNLAKLSSTGHIEGFYYVPRVDKEIIQEYKEDLIVTTGGLQGEVPSLILNVGEKQAEEALIWWKETFGDDFYIELNRHGLEEEDRVNEVLLRFAKKHNIKYFAANNTFYIDQEDAEAHDILLCVKEGEKKSTPIGRGRGFRYGFPNDQFYFKGQHEMKEAFKDLPDSIRVISEILDKVEPFTLARDVLLPKFSIPNEFQDPEDEKDGGNRGENAYLRHLTYEGAKKRYGEITDEIKERLDFELETIARTGYPGYFLIVQDFTTAAREMGVSVGPGRGSAAGSAVAYCIGITNVDPIKYDLLFERFLNPDRVSMPDIDIDFDDEGRGRIIDWVVDKYGASQVAQIITYGTMAAKSSIRDTARVLDLPLPDADRLAKLVPDTKLNKLFSWDEKKIKEKLNSDQITMAKELIGIAEKNDLEGQTVSQAKVLEGSVRNTGIHACGVIITPSDIRNHVPVAVSKDASLWCTQFDNSVVEDAGLLKMDFLGLKTLTLIKDAIEIVKERHGVEIDPDEIPLDDEKTYELFQRGETVGIFQYESAGMQKYMKELKPTEFADLIAMNALYRPGPLEYIPSFIKRKHGLEEITYDLPEMEEYLKETYGITVYQEQVMLLSQKLAGFTKGEADVLRKAMGKKIFTLLEKLKPKFIDQGKERGHPKDVLEKIWKDWEAFASYAFNKSHSTCYAWVAFQTAYLKANYPAEYMASVLSNNMNDLKQVTFFMEECKRSGVPVLGPDVNESNYKFTVNDKGEIRFGLGAVKGVGRGAVAAIVEDRKENGAFSSIFDLTSRVDLKAANKKAMEGLALAGAFDSFEGAHRSMYFHEETSGSTFLEKAVKYGLKIQQGLESAQVSMFDQSDEMEMPEPELPDCEPWDTLDKLSKEKEVVGIYISGHPLDDYKLEMDHFCTHMVRDVKEIEKLVNQEVKLAGIVTGAEHRTSKRGNPFGTLEMEDYGESHKFFLFGETYLKFKHFLSVGNFLFVEGKVVKSKNRWNDEERIDFNFHNVNLLSEARNNITSKLELSMALSDVTDDLIDQVHALLDQNKGDCKVQFTIYDQVENMKLKMPSRMKGVHLNNALFQELEKIKSIEVKLA